MASKVGWAFPANSRKFHYFVDGTALCGKWFCIMPDLEGDFPLGTKRGPDDCAVCFKRREAQRTKSTRSAYSEGDKK